ncbi:DUF4238 domain-containing protein [Natronocalculus amylovorans]|uniref:DUF4238 domain-containing protein n=1 Tax=Natronocalculus amylovorans TaxID=2917812 RepID=A0AAE3FX89_9EURY|nr:DUF4238 domain-containing protein [Natronocalculus amylovorans]MCL9817014.1 DUF4238 domain-containing protein [Natronocalculus amylovorans]
MRDKYIRQHYVPKHHLKQFSPEPDGSKVWCYDKYQQKSFQVSTRKIAVENYFYDGPEEDADTERWLHNLENKIADENGPYDKIMRNNEFSTRILTPREIYYFAMYISVQELRTRMWRDILKNSSEKLANILGEDIPAELKHEISNFSSEASLRKFQTDFFKKHVPRFSDMLVNRMEWNVIENKTSVPLWTSDHPVIRYNTNTRKSAGGKGLLSWGIEIFFPLSPNKILHLLDKEEYNTERQFITDEFHDVNIPIFYNDLQVQNSTRHIFSISEDFEWVEKRLSDSPELKNPDRDLVNIQYRIPDDTYTQYDHSYR